MKNKQIDTESVFRIVELIHQLTMLFLQATENTAKVLMAAGYTCECRGPIFVKGIHSFIHSIRTLRWAFLMFSMSCLFIRQRNVGHVLRQNAIRWENLGEQNTSATSQASQTTFCAIRKHPICRASRCNQMVNTQHRMHAYSHNVSVQIPFHPTN